MALPFVLQSGETVILEVRRHPVYLYPRLAGMLLAGVIPAAVLLVLLGTAAIWLIIAALWLAFWLVRAYFTWYRYQHDLWIITDQRVVDSIKRHWFHHNMASTDLVDVEDIAVLRNGIMATFFNYGTVQLQTAGAQVNFMLSGIPKPADVLGTIDGARDNARRSLAVRV